eukprot:4343824-Alexandrium_andersonii.AAC.1
MLRREAVQAWCFTPSLPELPAERRGEEGPLRLLRDDRRRITRRAQPITGIESVHPGHLFLNVHVAA